MTNTRAAARRDRTGEEGFTLIEALVAMVILIFGIAAVSNLMIVAGTSNKVAGHSTAATAAATEQMELLKAVPANLLAAGGDIEFNDLAGNPKPLPAPVCGAAPTGIFGCHVVRKLDVATGDISGGGTIHVRWRIVDPAGATNTKFIEVQAQSEAPAMARRSRARLTTFRTF